MGVPFLEYLDPPSIQSDSNRLDTHYLCLTNTFQPFDYTNSKAMNKFNSLTQIAEDDTPIGERAYPTAPQNHNNYRLPLPADRMLAAPGWHHASPHNHYSFDARRSFPEDRNPATPAWDLVVPDSEGTPKSTGSPREDGSTPRGFSSDLEPDPKFDTPPQASSDIEFVSGNLPKPRTISRDVKPGLTVTGTRDLVVQFTFYLPKGTDLSKGPPKKNSKPVYQTIQIPITRQTFQVNNHSLSFLKARLFSLASQVDNDPGGGNTAILTLADAGKTVKICGYIARHNHYAKDHNRPIASDEQVKAFYSALPKDPVGNCGFTVTMDNPSKTAQVASAELTKSQGRLRAQHTLQHASGSTTSDIAHAAPADPQKQFLAALQSRHSSLHTNKGEGWRIFNRQDLTQKMELTFKALILWSEELAKGTQGITIDDPPVKIYPDDFIWIDIILKDVGGKRSLGQTPSGDISPVSNTTPVGNTAPMSAIKRAKVHEELKFRIGSYEEMQGHSINIDYKLVRRLSYDLPIEKYFKYCDLDEAGIEKDVNILATHGIISFRRFLFPEVLDAKTIASWGIKWDTAIELMTRSREYYTYLVAIEEERIERRRIYDDDMEFLRQSELRVPPLNKGKGKAQG